MAFDLPPDVGPSRDDAILAHVTAGDYDASWTPLVVGDVELLVTGDALKIGGVRVNVSAAVQQQIADTLGALLLTPKIFDLMWLARKATLAPVIMPITSTTAAMVDASRKLDAELAAAGSPSGIVVQQKTWCIGNSLLSHPGRAMNYGFPVLAPGGIYKGIQTEAMVSVPASRGRVIQGQGWAHDPSHVDYSQNCFLVHRTCKMGGADRDLADLLVDPMIAPSLSHEGVLQVLRQPGVPLFACALPAKMKTGAVNPQLCPTPAPPARTAAPPEKTNWGLVGVTVGLVGLTVAGFALALRHAGRAHA